MFGAISIIIVCKSVLRVVVVVVFVVFVVVVVVVSESACVFMRIYFTTENFDK